MKKKFIIIILSIISCVMIIGVLFMYLSSINFAYKINWNIDIPNPKKVISKYNNTGFQYGLYLDIFHYNQREIMQLISKLNFQKIDRSEKLKLTQKYNEFMNNLEEELQKKFDDVIQPETNFNNNNYYVYLEKNSNKSNYCLLLMVLDVINNKVYVIQYFK